MADNSADGFSLEVVSGLARSGTPSFTGNVLTGNGRYGITVRAEYAGELDASSSFVGNTLAGVRVVGDTVATTATWQALDEPFFVDGTVYVHGSANPLVTVADGATLRFALGAGIYAGWSGTGALRAVGTAARGITFTSAQTTPSRGDWNGVHLGSSCDDAATVLQYVTVAYAGATSTVGNVDFSGCNGTIRDSTVRDSLAWGIYRQGGAAPTIANIIYANNALGDLF